MRLQRLWIWITVIVAAFASAAWSAPLTCADVFNPWRFGEEETLQTIVKNPRAFRHSVSRLRSKQAAENPSRPLGFKIPLYSVFLDRWESALKDFQSSAKAPELAKRQVGEMLDLIQRTRDQGYLYDEISILREMIVLFFEDTHRGQAGDFSDILQKTRARLKDPSKQRDLENNQIDDSISIFVSHHMNEELLNRLLAAAVYSNVITDSKHITDQIEMSPLDDNGHDSGHYNALLFRTYQGRGYLPADMRFEVVAKFIDTLDALTPDLVAKTGYPNSVANFRALAHAAFFLGWHEDRIPIGFFSPYGIGGLRSYLQLQPEKRIQARFGGLSDADLKPVVDWLNDYWDKACRAVSEHFVPHAVLVGHRQRNQITDLPINFDFDGLND